MCVPRFTACTTRTEKRATHCSATNGTPAASTPVSQEANLSRSVLQRKPNVPMSSIVASCARHDTVKRPESRMTSVVTFSLFSATLTCNGDDVTCWNVLATQAARRSPSVAPTM